MGDDMYNYDDKNLSSSSSSQDEISLFLRQILLRSSSSSLPHYNNNNNNNSSSSMSLENARHSSFSSLPLLQDGKISAVGSNTGFLTASAGYGGGSAANVLSSSSLGLSENDTDDCDCESEEGVEALAEEVPIKSVPSRSSSKRSRAAEVHNLSEKRRRSRINEKMKALQNLIPNSNKTDKASMLDEAIEYLKQLQLQVQMLSMRNGLNLHPMCLPEGFQPLQFSRMSMELSEENRTTIPLNMTDTLPLNQGNPLHYASNLPNKPTVPNQQSVIYPSYHDNSETSFGLESPTLAHVKPLQARRSSETSREGVLQQHQQSNASHSDANPLGGSQVVKELESSTLAAASLSFDMQTPEPKDKSSLQPRIAGRDQSAAIIRNTRLKKDGSGKQCLQW